jgi:hypothetical protein
MAELDGSILVVHPDRKSQRLIQRVLGSCGREVVVTDGCPAAALVLRDGTPALLVIASSLRLSPDCDGIVDRALAAGTLGCVVVHEERAAPPVQLFGVGWFQHLITASMPVLAEELVVTVQKLLRGDVFGMDKYLGWGASTGATEIVSTDDRLRALGDLGRLIEKMQLGRRPQAAVMLAADELVLNAVHNAAVDDQGVHYLRELPRDTSRALVGRERPRLTWGCDGRWFAVSVRDSYGTADPTTLARYVAKSLVQSGQIRYEGAGAGIGLAMTYASVTQLVFNIDPGRASEAIALIDLRPWAPASLPTLASFHLFFTRPAEVPA